MGKFMDNALTEGLISTKLCFVSLLNSVFVVYFHLSLLLALFCLTNANMYVKSVHISSSFTFLRFLSSESMWNSWQQVTYLVSYWYCFSILSHHWWFSFRLLRGQSLEVQGKGVPAAKCYFSPSGMFSLLTLHLELCSTNWMFFLNRKTYLYNWQLEQCLPR